MPEFDASVRIGSINTVGTYTSTYAVRLGVTQVSYDTMSEPIRIGSYWISTYTNGLGQYALGACDSSLLGRFFSADGEVFLWGSKLATKTDGNVDVLSVSLGTNTPDNIETTPFNGHLISKGDAGLLVKMVSGSIESTAEVIWSNRVILIAKISGHWHLVVDSLGEHAA